MRLPSTPETPKNDGPSNRAVGRDPSYPDRARIDSDVRAFLRPVSTPWIVFDRDSRVDDFAKSALRVGAVFASTPSFRPEILQAAAATSSPAYVSTAPAISDVVAVGPIDAGPIARMFPPSSGFPDSVVEPSNVVVCTDVMAESASYALAHSEGAAGSDAPRGSLASNPFATGMLTRRGRVGAIMGAFAGIAAIAGVSALALGARNVNGVAMQTTRLETLAVAAPTLERAVSPDAPTLELDAPAPAAAPEVALAAAAPAALAAPAEPKTAAPADAKKRFGKLTIKADAKNKNVWFDGKRMLGSGQRSFLVFCGMHTVAVSDKADTKDVEIPCNGEYAVAK